MAARITDTHVSPQDLSGHILLVLGKLLVSFGTFAAIPGGTGEMNEEYTNLVRHRDNRRKSTASELGMDDEPIKRPWWAPWRGRGKKGAVDGNFEVPDDWLDSELKQGLSTHEVESRRKKTGFNELTTEKENM